MNVITVDRLKCMKKRWYLSFYKSVLNSVRALQMVFTFCERNPTNLSNLSLKFFLVNSQFYSYKNSES